MPNDPDHLTTAVKPGRADVFTPPPRQDPPADNPDRDPTVAPSTRISMANRPSVTTVGTLVWLVSQLMFFTGLLGIYFTARAVTPGAWPPGPTQLNVPYAIGLTAALLASSVTAHLGAAAIRHRAGNALRRWYLVSALLGLVFIVGQLNQYRFLSDAGLTVNASAFSAVFYLITGVHALTVLGGVIAIGRFAARLKPGAATPADAVRALVLSYNWHFLNITWIGVFTAVYLIH